MVRAGDIGWEESKESEAHFDIRNLDAEVDVGVRGTLVVETSKELLACKGDNAFVGAIWEIVSVFCSMRYS